MNSSSSTSSAAAYETNASGKFTLHVLTGFALLGLLVTGIWDFAGFTGNERLFYQLANHGGNYRLFTIISYLFDGKMLSLLTLVFGAGIAVFLNRKEEPGSLPNADIFIRRQIWLIVLGLVLAFILLWPKDVLYPFGIVGILLFAFGKLPARSLLITALICMAIYCGKNYWFYADDVSDHKKYVAITVVEKKFKDDSTTRAKKFIVDKSADSLTKKKILGQKKLADSLAKKKDTLTNKQADEKGKWEGMVAGFKYDSSKTVKDNTTMRKGYGKIWAYRKGSSQYRESYWLYSFGVWDIASLMLLGMALLGMGFFNGRYSSGKYFVIALLLLIAGFALTRFRLHSNQIRIADYAKYIDNHSIPYNQFLPVEQLLLAAGYASLIMSVLQLKFLQWLWIALSAVGKMPVTNYVLQTLIGCFIFYGYGFGYYGRFPQWGLYAMVAEISLVQIVFSVFWFRYYQTGPLEWLLKNMIYRKWVPLLKQPPVTDITNAN